MATANREPETGEDQGMTDSQLHLDSGSRRLAGLAGAASVGLALALSELMAGLFGRVPSAIAAVGGFVVDYSPPFVKEVAITVFGTADKGALAIGTVIVGLIVGAFAGVASLRRPWISVLAFGVFGLLGAIAAAMEPLITPVGAVLAVTMASLAGWLTLRWLLGRVVQRTPELPTDGVPVDPERRRAGLLIGGVGLAAVVAGLAGRQMIISRSEAKRSAMDLPEPVTTAAPPTGDQQFAEVAGLTPIVVPNDQFYRIDTALVVPRPDPDSWTMKVAGLVQRPLEFTMNDLLGMELHERYVTIACVSNEVGGDLVGNAKWTGVRLVEVLERAGVAEGATQIVGRSVDGWTAGFPTELAFDGRDPLIAIGMNGEPLPPRHGFPARLIVPGLYGYVSATKWLEEIELTTWDAFDGYWIPRGWSKTGPIKTQSRIDYPRRGELVNGSPAVIAGVAWAPTVGIERVEVRIGDGPWMEAELTSPLSDDTWVQWKLEVPIEPGDHAAHVRATDATGTTQISTRSPVRPDGATGHHGLPFRTS
jgi:DMSO/TMAO reductase YedYZ molybdopterin-dependent catalytic subunit